MPRARWSFVAFRAWLFLPPAKYRLMKLGHRVRHVREFRIGLLTIGFDMEFWGE